MRAAATLMVLLAVSAGTVTAWPAASRWPAMSQAAAQRMCADRGGRLPDVSELLDRREELVRMVPSGADEASCWFWSRRVFRYNSTEQFGIVVDVCSGDIFRRYRTNHLSVYCVGVGTGLER